VVWQLEDIFSTAHENLRDSLKMLCLRASDHMWFDILGDGKSKRFHLYCVSALWLLYIADISCWILHSPSFSNHSASSTHIYHVGLWWQTNFD
jgi:hypothetical protein